jgi:hypothetical protein
MAAQAPGLEEAMERAVAEGTPYVILDGKIVSSDRCHAKTVSRKGREIDLWYSGKKKDFGGNIQGLFYPDGLAAALLHDQGGNRTYELGARPSTYPNSRGSSATSPARR